MITTTQNPKPKTTAMKTKPIHELRLGSIKAAIWKNEINGAIHYNTTFARLYKERRVAGTTSRSQRRNASSTHGGGNCRLRTSNRA